MKNSNDNNELVLSKLGHTWILDLDGSIVKHNGYKIDGYDSFLDGAKQFLDSIPSGDMIIFITSRKEDVKIETEQFLQKNGVRYNCILWGAPYGERILLNDDKLSGLTMAFAISKKRDSKVFPVISFSEDL